MSRFGILMEKFSKLQTVFKSFFVVLILFLIFFGINLLIILKNKPQSAYTVLSNEPNQSIKKLQDTRVHNWSEIEKEKKNTQTK